MGTTNGFGTQFYDWEYLRNGDAEATIWLVAAFFPIAPLRRVRLRVHTSGEKPSFFALNSGGSFQISYDELETVPNSPARIARTYLKGWVLTPLILLAPLLVMIALSRILPREADGGPNALLKDHFGWFAAVQILHIAIVVSIILDRCSGRRKSPNPLRSTDFAD